jgi:hypothetical protein
VSNFGNADKLRISFGELRLYIMICEGSGPIIRYKG